MSSDTAWSNQAFQSGVLARPFHVRLRGVLDELDMSYRQIAEELGINRKYLNELLHGRAILSPAVALRIEQLTGTPAERLWIWQGLTTIATLRSTSQHSG